LYFVNIILIKNNNIKRVRTFLIKKYNYNVYKMTKKSNTNSTTTKNTNNKQEVKAVVPPVEPVVDKAVVNEAEAVVEKPKNKSRSFKAIYCNPSGQIVKEGRYCGAKPKQAACKAMTGIYKIFKEEGKDITSHINYGVYETTRGSRNKNYWYTGQRVELQNPVEVDISKVDAEGNKVKHVLTYHFNNNVKRATEDTCKHLKNAKDVEDTSGNSTKKVSKKVTKKTKVNKSGEKVKVATKQNAKTTTSKVATKQKAVVEKVDPEHNVKATKQKAVVEKVDQEQNVKATKQKAVEKVDQEQNVKVPKNTAKKEKHVEPTDENQKTNVLKVPKKAVAKTVVATK
jgi:hypothetical protein